jgi:hypothetical protein
MVTQVFRPLWFLIVVLRKVVVEWLFGLFRGSELRSIARDCPPKVFSRASFWVAFHGCSLKHTNGGHQCWGYGGRRLSNSNKEGMETWHKSGKWHRK